MSLLLPSLLDTVSSLLKTVSTKLPVDGHPPAATSVLASAFALVTLYGLYKQLLVHEDPGCPTVPYKYPILGSTIEYLEDPQAFIEKWTQELGPIYRVHVLGRMQTVISGHHVLEIFRNPNFNFQEAINKTFNVTVISRCWDREFKSEDLYKMVARNITSHLNEFSPRVQQHLEIGCKDILGDGPGPIKVPDLFPFVQHMIAKASSSIFVGPELAKNTALIQTFKDITMDVGREIATKNILVFAYPTLNQMRMWYIGKYNKKLQQHKRQLSEALAPEVAKRLAGASQESWERPNDILQDIMDQCVTVTRPDLTTVLTKWLIVLIFVSIHTTSEHANIVLYRLAQHPEVIRVLLEEQEDVLNSYYGSELPEDKHELFNADVIKKFVKLDSVCREAMRLRNDYFDLPHMNMTKEKIVLSCGAVIPAGEDILMNQWCNHRDMEIQNGTSDLHEFRPFRFVGDQRREATKVGEDFLPFGVGRHSCPGRYFAVHVMKTMISMLIREYKITLDGPLIFPTQYKNHNPIGQVIFEKKIL